MVERGLILLSGWKMKEIVRIVGDFIEKISEKCGLWGVIGSVKLWENVEGELK